MTPDASPLHDALALLERVLAPGVRAELVDSFMRGGKGGSAVLGRLRRAMASHSLGAAGEGVALDKVVRRLDQRTRQDGFHVLHNWNPSTHRFTDDIVPVLMLERYERAVGARPVERVSVSLLLDYYLVHLLTLGAMRAWDDADPDSALERTHALLQALQGEHGSGHRFVADAETLVIYALSQFHPDEQAYDRQIERISGLRSTRQVAFARPSAGVLGAHLRWGFWLMYGRDVLSMRRDNVGDYPWLLRSVGTLLKEWVRAHEADEPAPDREGVVGALLQGLAADPWAFTGKVPDALTAHAGEHAEVRALLEAHVADLLTELEAHRPTKEAYAPLSLHFNFPHNALVAILSLALATGAPQPRPLNDLFERDREGGLVRLALDLTEYSGVVDRLGAQGARLVAYDPFSGMRSFTLTADTLRKAAAGG
jgi:hypothetical protein